MNTPLHSLVLQDDVLALGAEQHLHAVVGQIVLDGQIQLLGLLGAQMTDGAVHQLQAGVDGVLADLLDVLAGVDALHMGVGTELEVDLIGVMDELLCELLADQAGQVAAHLIGEAQLAVRDAPAPEKPVVMAQVGRQLTQWPSSALGQWRFSTGLPFSTSRIFFSCCRGAAALQR